MHATFRQLRLLVALADTGSITGAARACHVTQPTVSMQIKELADAVGMPLHEQIGRALYLTPAGEAVAESARAMVAEWEALEQRIAGLKVCGRDVCGLRWPARPSTSFRACWAPFAPGTLRWTSSCRS